MSLMVLEKYRNRYELICFDEGDGELEIIFPGGVSGVICVGTICKNVSQDRVRLNLSYFEDGEYLPRIVDGRDMYYLPTIIKCGNRITTDSECIGISDLIKMSCEMRREIDNLGQTVKELTKRVNSTIF